MTTFSLQTINFYRRKDYFGQLSARLLLNTVYFYNGKLFGLRASEHRSITLANIRIFDDCIKFEENVSKTFHGGICKSKVTSE